MVAHSERFSDLVEMIERLPLDDRASLLDIVQKRIVEDERHRIAASIRAARREHRRGRSKPMSPADIMREIRS
jgi:hypothetical protein